MDDKDYLIPDPELKDVPAVEEEAVTAQSELQEYDTEISGIGVNYENNDNWKFDAEAATLSTEAFEKSDFGYGIAQQEEAEAPQENESYEQPAKRDQIVIDKSTLVFIPVALFVALCVAIISVLSVRYFTVPNGKEGKYANPGAVVATIGDTKITEGMFSYSYSSVLAYYQQYAETGLDMTKDLNSQMTTDKAGNEITWEKRIENEAFEQIKQTTAVYNKAVDMGLTLTSAQQAKIKEHLDSMKSNVAEGQSFNQYLENLFGKYCTEDTIKFVLDQYYMSLNYSGYINSQAQPTEDEIENFYTEHKGDFNQISFSFLAFEYDSTSDKTKADSMKKAESYMKKIKDRDSIVKLVPEVYKEYIESDAEQIMASDETMSKKDAIAYSTDNYKKNVDYVTTMTDTPLDSATTEWLFDDATKVGDKKCYVNEDAGYIYVILKTEKASADKEETYSVRHILIMPKDDEGNIDTTGEKEFTDKQWKEAEKTAKNILKKYNQGEKNEYNFALLAEQYSDDVASTSAAGVENVFGGICAATKIGNMVPEFEKWSIDESRKYGDTDIVKSQYGYHIMFFINDTESYKSNVITSMRKAEVNAVIDASDVVVNQSKVDKAVKRYNEFKNQSSLVSAAGTGN